MNSSDPPSPADLLRWCSEAEPELWFPALQAQASGIDRSLFDEPLSLLRQAELMTIRDWVKGQGQGYALTPLGREVTADPLKWPTTSVPVAPRPPEPRHVSGMTHFDRGEITREAFLAPRSSIVAPALVIALIAWFVISMVVAYRLDISLTQFLQSGNPKVLLNVGGAFGPSILDGEWWRLFTSGFVHVGAIHLAANCFSLILIGPVVEGLWGRWRFAGIYMLAGIAASFAATGLHPMAIVAGASGSIWGLQLATLAWLLRYREHIPRNVFSEWLRRLAVVLGVNIAISFVPGISWEGHFAGGIIGFIAAAFLDMIRPESGRRAIFLGIVGLITLIAATTAGFLATLRYSNDWHQLRALREPRSARPFPMNELRRIAPDRLGNAHATLLVAFTTGSVRNKESATEALDQLESDILSCRSSLTDVTGVIPKPFEEYLNALRDFIAMARPLLASAKIPGATETKPFGALRDRADTSWARLMEWMAKPENAR